MSSSSTDPAALTSHPHRRFNPLTGQWLLVSPHRTQRPWQGHTEPASSPQRPPHDPRCYLCAGSTRAGGAINPPYQGTFVFDNDFAALRPDTPLGPPPAAATSVAGLFRTEPVAGTCRVMCFSPRHDLTLAQLSAAELQAVIDTWAAQTAELGQRYRWVQVFENKGAIMGCSNPHPHGQIWASSDLPNEAASEDQHQRGYFSAHGQPLLGAYAEDEIARQERVVIASKHWLVVVPFWAVWPFETLIVARQPLLRLPDLDGEGRRDLAAVLSRLLRAYDLLFGVSFPYSMGWHGAPYPAASRIRGSDRPAGALALPRARLPTAAAVGNHQEVHGGVRNAGRTAARPDPRVRRCAPARLGRRPASARARAGKEPEDRPLTRLTFRLSLRPCDAI